MPTSKSAGGVKLDEPAIDLAVAAAIASSYKDKPTNPQECFVGELGLTGEVRWVNRIEQRINEAAKLRFYQDLCSEKLSDGDFDTIRDRSGRCEYTV